MAIEVQDALHLAVDGCGDDDLVRGRLLAFICELPEDMTVQEILESLKVGADDDDNC